MATQAKRFEELDADKKTMEQEKTTDEGLYFEKKTADGKVVLTEDMAPECIGTAFPGWKKVSDSLG